MVLSASKYQTVAAEDRDGHELTYSLGSLMSFLGRLKSLIESLFRDSPITFHTSDGVMGRRAKADLDSVFEKILTSGLIDHESFRQSLSYWRLSFIGGRSNIWSEFRDSRGISLNLGEDPLSPKVVKEITNDPDSHYRRFEIRRRGSGAGDSWRADKPRVIDSPDQELMRIQKCLLKHVFNDFDLVLSNVCHSYRVNRSTVTCVRPHSASKWMICMDLKDFFPSISRRRVCNSLVSRLGCPPEVAEWYSHFLTVRVGDAAERVLPQGAPASGFLSNLCLVEFDQRLVRSVRNLNSSIVVTRYADDIILSGAEPISNSDKKAIIAVVTKVAEDCGFLVNRFKTRVSSSKSVMRVLGIDIIDGQLYPKSSLRKHLCKQIDLLHQERVSTCATWWGRNSSEDDCVLEYIDHIWGLVKYCTAINREYGNVMTSRLRQIEFPLSGKIGLMDF